MLITGRNLLQCTSTKLSYLPNIRDIVLNSKQNIAGAKSDTIDNAITPKTSDVVDKIISKKDLISKKGRNEIKPLWVNFNSKYNTKYDSPKRAQLQKTNEFFNKAKVEFEWGVGSFRSIPSEIVKANFKEKEMDGCIPSNSAKRFPGKTKIPFKLINGLPEIAFLGSSNAGKSTLLNNLTTQLGRQKLNQEARMSSKPGFTKTLNCFNIGNKFRLVDTPGYGFGSRINQGGLTMEYIENREELVRCYVLIPGDQGFTNLDIQILHYLRDIGKPFEIIFTKMDKVRDLVTLEKEIERSGIMDFPSLPRLLFTNSSISKNCTKRYGISGLRCTILQCCNLLD
ncbi:similar to Saccharomyces cerevisiae YDR336W Putative protein of unknown function [Maudiozyma saulgeensis]|uniref:EngB-type G domain-containing protein n=1 Tax=Maudiozyma saulgeensis TaxID=1789683 RepID=A0A1X7R1Y8_9SACH|nr:similar to Saccharomyces cerevisiae YDR336W Putative protein of unknown function [Kazachstania saulgeensis]